MTQMTTDRIDGLVGFALMGVGALVAAWYALTGLGLALEGLFRHGIGIRVWGAPLVRRLGVGLTVTGFVSSPALAGEPPEDLAWGSASTAAKTLVLDSTEGVGSVTVQQAGLQQAPLGDGTTDLGTVQAENGSILEVPPLTPDEASSPSASSDTTVGSDLTATPNGTPNTSTYIVQS